MSVELYVEEPDLHQLSKDQLLALNVASLAGGSLSVISILVTSYWFVRMRRSFRHDLIMLLMQSDMLKATWFTIYPIVQLAHGVVKSDSAFCQVSGFFLAVGIEACDVAVVLIALHTALCIIGRGTADGLQPYRRVAQAFFIAVPLLLASLAFISNPGYVNSGEFCYLPLHPNWKRQSLSWIPRYTIFGTILLLYAFIYIRVSLLVGKYSQRPGATRCLPAQARRWHVSPPPLPRISTHGLIPSVVSSRRVSAETKTLSRMERSTADGPPALPAPVRSASARVSKTLPVASDSPCHPNLLAMLRRGQLSSSSRTASSVLLSPALGLAEMREHVMRQTRTLFVFPLVYMGVWLVPLISHLMGGDRLGAPFGVMITGLVSLAIQGSVDALVFSIREKPWRDSEANVNGRRIFWSCHDEQPSTHGASVGRSVEDMVVDRRIARWRLDEELEERRLERPSSRPVTIDWWDHEHRRVLLSVDSVPEHDMYATEEDESAGALAS